MTATPPQAFAWGGELLRRHARHGAWHLELRLALDGVEERREGWPRNVAAGAAPGVELAVGPHDVALRDGVRGHALHRETLEDVVVDLLVMGLGRDGAPGIGVPHQDVGVRPDAQRALA